MRETKVILVFSGVSLILFLFFSCAPSKISLAPAPERTKNPEIRVLISSSPVLSVRFHGKFLLHAPEAVYQISEQSAEFFFSYDGGLLFLYSDQRQFRFKTGFPLWIAPAEEMAYFQMGGKRYRGKLQIQPYFEDQIAYILETDLEEYLLGVVPAEIPTGRREYLAAVKAQAIAARTYAYMKIMKSPEALFHIYDDHRDQVLGDMIGYNEYTHQAVTETRGIILSSERKEFIPYYHSTCGGAYFTDPNGNQALPDKENPDQSYFCTLSPLFRWYRLLDIRWILENAVNNKLFNLPENFDSFAHDIRIRIGERDGSGRVKKLEISVDGISNVVSGFAIRKLFADSSGSPLPSEWFFMAPYSADSLKFLIVGAGYGHGRGMCQWGAIGMALAGKTYTDILTHYYPEATIRRVY